MKRFGFHRMFNPLLLLATVASCDGMPTQMTIDGGDERCASGIDSDGDGLNNDAECAFASDPYNSDTDQDSVNDAAEKAAGTNPNLADTDGDGLWDKDELAYPKICVAADRNLQRRDASSNGPACDSSAQCQSGESCNGLDPTRTDSDGDGISDLLEDRNRDGRIEFSAAETDPRLWDTDGDGASDADSATRICLPDALSTVVRTDLSGTGIQLGLDPAFGPSQPISGTLNRSGVAIDDNATSVAGLVVEAPTTGALFTDDATAVEATITGATALGGISGATVKLALSGQAFKTHEQNDAIRSIYQITLTGMSTPSAVRDSMVLALTGSAAPGGGSAVSQSNAFIVNITTVRRENLNLNDIIVAVSPTSLYTDATKLTVTRANDLANATGVTEAGKELSYDCQGYAAQPSGKIDFIWTVDISGSMGTYQQRLGNTAKSFFQRMIDANVDIRVGVFEASNSEPASLSAASNPAFPSGFTFIQGQSANAGLTLCRQVTFSGIANGFCPEDGNTTKDPFNPYPLGAVTPANGLGDGSKESPVAAAVVLFNLFKKNAANGVTTSDFILRSDAVKAAFMITDEPGATLTPSIGNGMNDWFKYFGDKTVNPDNNQRWSETSPTSTDFIGGFDAATLGRIIDYFKTNQILTYGMLAGLSTRTCASPNPRDLPRCTVEGNGGFALDIEKATDPVLVAVAIDQMATDLIGASSKYKLSGSPITSTIRVNVNGTDVPRSRSNGFDYDTVSQSLAFFGTQYNPQAGQQVVVSYRVGM